MTEWKEYTGSDEQFLEIYKYENDVLLKYATGTELFRSNFALGDFINHGKLTHYMLCDPHPNADMICQQAKTGQPVWVRVTANFERYGYCYSYHQPTTTPDWNIPNAEYSLTEFKEEV